MSLDLGGIGEHVRPWRIAIPILAIAATTLALLLAVFAGGPLARAVFGVPAGFGEHFTSIEGYRQAWLVQGTSLSLVFVLLGIALGRAIGRPGFGWALLAANPITVGAGFVIFKLFYESLPLEHHSIEYFNIRDGVLLALLAPLVFAFCWRVGALLVGLRSRRI